MSYTYFAKIIDAPRRELWQRYLARDTMPIISPHSVRASVPDHPEALVYLVDFDALGIFEQMRLVTMLSEEFGMDEREVWDELDRWPRVPILAEGVIVDVCGGEGQVRYV